MPGGAAGIAAGVTENIVSRFSVQDDYTQQALGLASTALGVGRALAGFEAAFAVAQSALGMIQGPMRESMQLNQRYQQSVNDIAGTLASLNVVGQTAAQMGQLSGEALSGAMASNMSMARQQASALVGEMQATAARLPGETSDYITTFTAALPSILQATGRTTREIMDLTSQATASGISKNIGAMQSGMDLMRIFSHQAQLDVRLWNEVIHPMSRDPRRHGAGGPITGQQLNAMTGEQVFTTVKAALDRYSPLINSFADTWDTQVGTFTSGINELKRVLGGPIFDLAAFGLRELNIAIASVLPYIEKVGAALTGWAAGVLRPIITYFGNFFDTMGNLDGIMARFNQLVNATAFQPLIGAIQKMVDGILALTHIGNLFGGPAGANPIATGQEGAQTSSGLLGAILGPNAAAFLMVLSQGENVSRVLGALAGVVESLMNSLMATFDTYSAQVSDVIGSGAAQQAIDWLVSSINWLAGIIPDIMRGGLQVLEMVWGAISEVVALTIDTIGGIAMVFGALTGATTPLDSFIALIKLCVDITKIIVEVLVAIAGMFMLVVAIFVGILNVFKRIITGAYNLLRGIEEDALAPSMPTTDTANPPWLESLRNLMTHQDPVAQHLSENARTRQPVTHNHQDFRYSRFDITQKFAEGFDPDRIAAVFARDLEAMAEQRLDSGIAPGFSG